MNVQLRTSFGVRKSSGNLISQWNEIVLCVIDTAVNLSNLFSFEKIHCRSQRQTNSMFTQ